MKKFLLLLFVIASVAKQSLAQDQHLIDSLQLQLKKYDSTKAELQIESLSLYDTTEANILYALSKAYWGSIPNKAMEYAKQTLILSEQIGYKKGMGNAYNSMAVINAMKGDYLLALEIHKKALKIWLEIGYKKGLAVSYNNIGNIYRNQSNYPEALKNYLAALKIFEETGDKLRAAAVSLNIGIIYRNQGNFPEALKNYFNALKIREKLGDKNGIAEAYNNIGIIYKDQGNYPDALKNYFNALKIREEIGDKNGIAASYNNIGNIYTEKGKYPEALKNHFASLKIYEEIADKNGIAVSYINIGNNYKALGNYSVALENFFASLKIEEEIGDKYSIAACYNSIGNIYTKQKKYDEASRYLNKALSFSNEIGSLQWIKDSYDGLAKWDSAQGNFKEALEHYKLFITYRDSLVNEENTKKIVQSQMQYEFEKKEAVMKGEQEKKDAIAKEEIEKQKFIRNYTFAGVGFTGIFSLLLIFSYNRRRKTAFDNTVRQVEMKALRSQMNPHFIKNSLNSIDDYIRSNDIENSSLYVNRFSRLMGKILENSRKEQIPLQDDLESLELYIQFENLRVQNKVAYTIDVAPEINTEQILIQPMLLQPFVENAFKHAFNQVEHPKLEINVSMKDEMIHCLVTDNGKGRDYKKEIVFEAKDKVESLGVKVTQERLDIINKIKKSKAYIAFEDLKDVNQKAVGTKIELAVPCSFAF
ncbi:MAG TPA: tetratricopeptide repeat protein [Chitinophagales bacterium]|nr:tetratricopeptide repeat protein [Chitinophagales bacterium]